MKVQVAQQEDATSWLRLAAEVEHLFGPMVDDPGFIDALNRNIERGSALCVRESDGPPGAPLLAGMLFSARHPLYTVGWLAVSQDHRRCGLGAALLAHVMGLVRAPARIEVTTFAPNTAGGKAAREFYLKAGFVPGEMVHKGPDGAARQIFRKCVARQECWPEGR